MIVESLVSVPMSNQISSITDCNKNMSYEASSVIVDYVMNLTLSNSIAFLFSGSWRLNIDAIYLELRSFQQSQVTWHPNTLFVEPQQQQFYYYTLKKIRCDNLIILHSDYWCGHQPVESIVDNLQSLRQFASRVICSVPVKHTNFNKLTNSISDICQKTGASVCEDSFVFVK